MAGDKDFIYDEDESVKFIQNYLPQELKGKFSNDDINYIVDLIYEFYESKGCMSEDIDDDTEIEIDEDELTAFVVKNAKRDGVGKFTPEEITNGMESGSLLPKKSPLLYKARWRIANHWICLNK